MSKLTETKVDLTWKGFFGIFGDILTVVGQLLVQIWIITLWDHTERRKTKAIPEDIKTKIKAVIDDLKMNKMDEYNKNKEIYDCIYNVLDSGDVRYAKRDDDMIIENYFKFSFTKLLGPMEILIDIILKYVKEGNTITLGHPNFRKYYILFSDSATPENYTDDTVLRLWAHELVHVYQYKDLGFGSFTWKFGRKFFKNVGNRDELELEVEADQIANVMI